MHLSERIISLFSLLKDNAQHSCQKHENIYFFHKSRDEEYAVTPIAKAALVIKYTLRAWTPYLYFHKTRPVENTCPILCSNIVDWHFKRTSGSTAPLSAGVYANIARTRHPTNQSTLLSPSNAFPHSNYPTHTHTNIHTLTHTITTIRPTSTRQGCKV